MTDDVHPPYQTKITMFIHLICHWKIHLFLQILFFIHLYTALDIIYVTHFIHNQEWLHLVTFSSSCPAGREVNTGL